MEFFILPCDCMLPVHVCVFLSMQMRCKKKTLSPSRPCPFQLAVRVHPPCAPPFLRNSGGCVRTPKDSRLENNEQQIRRVSKKKNKKTGGMRRDGSPTSPRVRVLSGGVRFVRAVACPERCVRGPRHGSAPRPCTKTHPQDGGPCVHVQSHFTEARAGVRWRLRCGENVRFANCSLA